MFNIERVAKQIEEVALTGQVGRGKLCKDPQGTCVNTEDVCSGGFWREWDQGSLQQQRKSFEGVDIELFL